ncbi:hypothetical protein D3C87_1606400 [compost metagenome]
MVEFGDHDDDALLAAFVDQGGLHVEALDGGLERLLDGVAIDPFGRGEGQAHEEAAGFPIPELIALGDIGLERRQFCGDGGHDAGAIGAAEGQNEIGRGQFCLQVYLSRFRTEKPATTFSGSALGSASGINGLSSAVKPYRGDW